MKRLQIPRPLWTLLSLVMLLTAGAAQAQVVDSINGDGVPVTGTWSAATYGIEYTPSVSYVVTRIEANWGGTDDDKTITIQVYDENPNDGGVLLAEGSFFQSGPGWQGANLDNPVAFVAGEDYFIGFGNTEGFMGRFYVGGGGAQQFTVWWSNTPGEYEEEDNFGGYHDPIWRFIGEPAFVTRTDVPALSGAALAALATLLALAGFVLVRRS